MGKLADVKAPVKREVVSANLEVVSEEKFAKRLEGMNSCINCQKERTKGHQGHHRNHNRGKGKRKQAKAHTPIVIHLKDTLKAVLQQRQRSLDGDSDPSAVSDTDSMHISEIAMGDYAKHFHRDYLHVRHFDHPPGEIRRHPCKSKKKDTKNLHALISVIQKAHHKDCQNIECNLAKEYPQPDSKLTDMLNNATNPSSVEDAGKRRSIVECDNVELICNDLYNSSEKSYEDSESDKSSIVSSSENSSDLDTATQTDENNFEFSSDELEKLAQFTTGCPLIRYDCPPSECPECLSAWYSYQYYHFQGYSLYSSRNESAPSAENAGQASTSTREDISESEEEADNNSITSESTGATVLTESSSENSALDENDEIEIDADQSTASRYKLQRQLWDIGVSQRNKQGRGTSFPDSVYIDLTGTDVTFSVYYHHNAQEDNYAYHHPIWYPVTPAATPYCYWPPLAYYMSPMYGLSSPLSFFTDTSLPKTAMVPPHELKKFSTTHPPTRQWIQVQSNVGNRPTAIFTVMCYNVLCDKYCTRQQYGYCPSWALNWEYRKKGIMDEIRQWGADIISLQEVETDMFYNFFMPELKREGYDGIFSPKSRARTMSEVDRKHVDGCAIFFRSNKFTLVKEKVIEFNQLAMANAEGSDDMLNRVMTKDNIGLAALLETKEGAYENVPAQLPEGQLRQPLMVTTAHIHWDPEFSDVKLIQTMMLIWELKHIIEDTCHQFRPGQSGRLDCNTIPLLLCGDLNSLPESGVVEYLQTGRVPANHEDFKMHGYDTCLQRLNMLNEKDCLGHNFRLARAYDNDIMPYTNYTFDFKGIIDYIFYSRDYMNLLGMLGPLDEEWFRHNKVIGCPHPHVPSDHFPLFVQLEMPLPYPTGRSVTGGKAR